MSDFKLELRAGVWVVVYAEGGVRPATDVEISLWVRNLGHVSRGQDGSMMPCHCDVGKDHDVGVLDMESYSVGYEAALKAVEPRSIRESVWDEGATYANRRYMASLRDILEKNPYRKDQDR